MKKKVLAGLLSLMVISSGVTSSAEEVKAPSGLSEKKIEKKVDEIAGKYIDKEIPGLGIAVVKDGKVVMSKGYGYADLEKNIPLDAEKTVIEPGSVSKLFTWTAVMQLEEDGKIDLDEDISKYLPEGFLKKSFNEPITMKHLMSHTAGFEESVEKMMVLDKKDILPLDKYLAVKEQPKQIYRPGKITAYSNYSTDLAGYIVERVSGKSFNDYITKNIFKPMNMNHSTFEADFTANKYIVNNKSIGYLKTKEGFEAQPNMFINDGPAGSLNSTTSDMAKFMIAHLDENSGLFKYKVTYEKMHSNLYNDSPFLGGNAYGFWERSIGDKRIIEHGGNTVAFSSHFVLVPDEEFGVVVFNNLGAEVSGIYVDLMESLIGLNEKEKTTNIDKKHDKKIEGSYASSRGFFSNYLKGLGLLTGQNFTVKASENGGIKLSGMGIKNEEYREIAEYTYQRVSNEKTVLDNMGLDVGKMVFKLDKDGNVEKLSFGTVMDFIPNSFQDQTSLNQIVVGLIGIVMILNTIRYFIKYIVRKVKKDDEKLNSLQRISLWLGAVGTLVLINTMIVLFKIATNPYIDSISKSGMSLHLNYILPIAIIAGIIAIIKNYNDDKYTGKEKFKVIFMIVISIILSLVMLNFKLF